MDFPDDVKRWAPCIRIAASLHRIDPVLLAAVVWTESSGDPWAQRVERGFWKRYGAGIMRWVRSTSTRYDDKWARYPDVYASSYGLCQIMLQTAAENGFHYRFPGQLFDVQTNLNLGARLLAKNLGLAGGDERKALLRYNGGGDREYPDRVQARKAAVLDAGGLAVLREV